MGGFQDITIMNCTVQVVPPEAPHIFTGGRNGLTGIQLIIVDGGRMERVSISNVTIEGMRVPLSIRLGARGRGLVEPSLLPEAERPERLPVGVIRDISLANIVATGADKNCGIMLLGHPGHPLENISLANIMIRNAGGGDAKLASRNIPERAFDDPQAARWGDMSGYGLYARHVRGLSVSNVRLQTSAPDGRHALVLDDVEDAELDGLACMPASGTNALMRLSETRRVLIRGSQPRSANGPFLKVDGATTLDIALVGNDFSRVTRVIECDSNVPVGTVRESGNLKP
jgi:hypothetical protein